MNKTIPVIHAAIKPVAVFVPANAIVITESRGLPPVFHVAIGTHTPGKPAVPAKGAPDRVGYVPEVPAVESTFIPHKDLTIPMSKEAWDAWKDGDDEEYIRNYVLKELGYTKA